jgi:Flp pilus assembly protein TadD
LIDRAGTLSYAGRADLMRANPSRYRLLTATAVMAALAVSACKTTNSSDTTGSLAVTAARTDSDWRREAEIWGERYRQNQKNPDAAIRYAQALRAMGQRSQAVAVLEQAAIYNPKHNAVLGAYGRALADVGNFQQALAVLNRAHTPDQPDWRILSAQGAVLDQMGRHEEAQRHYSAALKIVPNEPAVLSNLGLSYALSRNLRQAEDTLRRANAQPNVEPRVRQNLALVVGLQGRFAEAEEIARGDLSPDEAAANVAYLRQMLAEDRERRQQKPPRRNPRHAASS